ncbi:MAG: hypothetical protein D6791_11975 [Chloroflexi bacterium]|nr:MAG: hypothetical protein D6791_11975 [Chloroflexota bacterium]
MNVKLPISVLCVMLLIPIAVQAGFQEFTVVYKVTPGPKASGQIPEKVIYRMDGKRLREDIFSREGQTAILLEIKGEKQISTILDPDSKTYLRNESPVNKDTLDLFNMPRSDKDPCAGDPKFTCKRLGTDKLLGYKVIKWKTINRKDGDTSVMWYAPKLGTFLKMEDDAMVMTATHVEDHAPPAHYFEIPANYKKMDVKQMMMQGMQDMGQSAQDTADEDRVAGQTPEIGVDEAEDSVTKGPMDETTDKVMEGLKNAIGNLFGK